MASHREFICFLYQAVAIMLASAILAIAFTVLIDPYHLYRWVDVQGFNRVKPLPDRYQEEIKLTAAIAHHPNVLILGNSRAEYGLDPNYAGFANKGWSAYNLALSGTKLTVAKRDLEYLRSIGQKPAAIVLGVEFLDFFTTSSATLSLAQHKAEPAIDSLKWKFDALFSLTSLSDSIKTMRIQRDDYAETITEKGLNPLREYERYAHEEGYYALFQQRAVEYAKTFSRQSHELALSDQGGATQLEGFRTILNAAALDGAELHLMIYPYHAQILAMFEGTALWPAFEQWKAMLAHEVDTLKEVYPQSRITLWDFSGFSKYQCERVPAKNDLVHGTQWYWEAGHFKQELGNRILARMFDPAALKSGGDGLGFHLTSMALHENQMRIAQERSACAAAYPELFDDISLLIKNAQEKLH